MDYSNFVLWFEALDNILTIARWAIFLASRQERFLKIKVIFSRNNSNEPLECLIPHWELVEKYREITHTVDVNFPARVRLVLSKLSQSIYSSSFILSSSIPFWPSMYVLSETSSSQVDSSVLIISSVLFASSTYWWHMMFMFLVYVYLTSSWKHAKMVHYHYY